MWLICAVPYTYCQNAYSVLCVVSSKRWLVMLLPGLAVILAAYQLYSVATQSLLQVLCRSQLPWCLQIPDKYFSVLLQCLPIPACCLAVFPCQTACAALLPVMCLLYACLKHAFPYPNMIIFIFALVSFVAWFYLVDLTSKQGNVQCLLWTLCWSVNSARFAVIVKVHILWKNMVFFVHLHFFIYFLIFVCIHQLCLLKKEREQSILLIKICKQLYTQLGCIAKRKNLWAQYQNLLNKTKVYMQQFVMQVPATLRYLNSLLNCTVISIMIKQNKTLTE